MPFQPGGIARCKSGNSILKYVAYILLFLVSIGVQFFTPIQKTDVQPVSSSDCAVQATGYHSSAGIQGELLTIANGGWSISISAPSHFISGAERVSFGKNRTRTAFLRRMIHHYQHVFLVFRGKERLEASPFATPVGSTYYVYGLRHILC